MIEATGRTLDYIGAGLIIFVFLVLVYGLIFIHDIPYHIAQKRHHPHQDAIHAAGWLSLFLVHILWPFLWIWALMHKPDLETESPGKPGEEQAAACSDEASPQTAVSGAEDQTAAQDQG